MESSKGTDEKGHYRTEGAWRPDSSNDPTRTRVRKRLRQFIAREGRRPRILVSCPEGRGKEQAAKMAAGRLADAGFDVDVGPRGLTPETTAKMAVENDVHAVCLFDMGQGESRIPEVLEAKLREFGSGDVAIFGIEGGDAPDDGDRPGTGFVDLPTLDPSLCSSVETLLDRLCTPGGPRLDDKAYIDGVLAGDRRMLAKTLSMVENRSEVDRKQTRRILEELYPHAGKAVRIGITGVPGAGKSTFIDRFGMRLIEMGRRVAVLAVDPSSSISGGSLLGDKTRMAELSADPSAFIRPSPSRSVLGGVAGTTREAILVCEAAGFDVVLVETVGVGQSEVAAASMVDFFLLLLVAGAGDRYQGIKKGIIEVADAIAISKADGDNIENAAHSREEYAKALGLIRPESDHWSPPVVTCSAHDPQSVDNVWQIVSSYVERLSRLGELPLKRARQSVDWMMSLLDQGLMDQFRDHPQVQRIMDGIFRSVENGDLPPEQGAERLLEAMAGPADPHSIRLPPEAT